MALDDAWLSEPPKRSRFRPVLLGLLATTLVFLGGVEVQKQYGVAGDSASATGPTGAFTPPTGGFGGFPTSGQSQAPSPSQGTGNAATVIGKLVATNGGVWTVRDFGGTRHRIIVGSSSRVVRESALDPADVKTGTTVSVAGTSDARGDVTATTITVR